MSDVTPYAWYTLHASHSDTVHAFLFMSPSSACWERCPKLVSSGRTERRHSAPTNKPRLVDKMPCYKHLSCRFTWITWHQVGESFYIDWSNQWYPIFNSHERKWQKVHSASFCPFSSFQLLTISSAIGQDWRLRAPAPWRCGTNLRTSQHQRDYDCDNHTWILIQQPPCDDFGCALGMWWTFEEGPNDQIRSRLFGINSLCIVTGFCANTHDIMTWTWFMTLWWAYNRRMLSLSLWLSSILLRPWQAAVAALKLTVLGSNMFSFRSWRGIKQSSGRSPVCLAHKQVDSVAVASSWMKVGKP